MDYPKIIAVDFDGTLAENAWPGIGAPIQSVIDAIKAEQAAGCITILWTNRCNFMGDDFGPGAIEGEGPLGEALRWCKAQGLEFDCVNENTPGMIEFFGNDCRKVFGNEYWDDRARTMPERACHFVDAGGIDRFGKALWASCGACGFTWPAESVADHFTYCPGCGARIIKEGVPVDG